MFAKGHVLYSIFILFFIFFAAQSVLWVIFMQGHGKIVVTLPVLINIKKLCFGDLKDTLCALWTENNQSKFDKVCESVYKTK